MSVTETLRIVMSVTSIVNALSSLLILALIHALRLRVSGYVLLIYSMSLCQAVFDASLMMLFECNQQNGSCLNTVFFVASAAGIASQGWSLVIASVVGYIIATRKRFDIDHHYPLFLAGVALSSLAVGTIRLLASLRTDFPISIRQSIYIYDGMRYIEIAVNLLVLAIVFRDLGHMAFDQLPSSPIYALAKKLLLYPAAQLLSRIGSTQYEDVYGISFPSDDAWNVKSGQALLYCLLTPLGGLLSLLIFVHVQPGAKALILRLLGCSSSHDDAQHMSMDDSSSKDSTSGRSPSIGRPGSDKRLHDDRDDDDEDDGGVEGLECGLSGLSAVALSDQHPPLLPMPLPRSHSARTERASLQHCASPYSALSEDELVQVILRDARAVLVKSPSASALHVPLLG